MSYNVFPFPSNVYPNSLPLDHRGQRSETPGHSHTPIPFYQQYQPYQPIYQPPPPASAPSHEQGMPWDAQAPQTHVHTHDSMGSGTPLHSIVSLEEDRYHSHQPDPPDGIHNRGTQQSLESRRNPKPPMLSRTRRGAASKARMTISSVTCSLRAPVLTPLSSNTSHDNSPLPSTILANTDDIKPDPKDIKSDISHVKGKKGKGRSSRKSSTHSPSSQRFTLKNSRGPLLPAPEGSSLEVNDLLILHPPSLSPSRASEPVNQYSEAPAPEGYQSRFEMYTCRVCSKTYDGKNARSVARRHLQDKHGVPLAMQQRRTRWDQEPDRPKTAGQAREKTLKSKREWASKSRLIHRFERVYAEVLGEYGPNGILTPCGTRVVAPDMRGDLPDSIRYQSWPDGMLAWTHLPEEMRVKFEAIQAGESVDLPDNRRCKDPPVVEEQQQEGLASPIPPPPAFVPRPGPAEHKAKKIRKQNDSISTSSITTTTTASSDTDADSPAGQYPISQGGATCTPISTARDAQTGQEGWNSEWNASATHVDDQALQMALAQHFGYEHHATGPSFAAPSQVEYAELNQETQNEVDEIQKTFEQEKENREQQLQPPASDAMDFEGQQHPPRPWQPHSTPGLWFPGQQTMKDPYTSQTTSIARTEEWSTDRVQVVDTPYEQHVEQGETEVETVAAESLLNLHSTPARLGDEEKPKMSSGDRGASPVKALLDAPEITSVPRPNRSESLIQPFAKSRPEAATQSLSFSHHPTLDDPFVITPAPTSGNGKKKRANVPSPSPLSKRGKVKLNVSSPHSSSVPRIPLAQVKNHPGTNLNLFSTPVRPGRVGGTGAGGGNGSMAVPSSLSKGWVLSSPGNTDAAASLGLVPHWGNGTPGVSGMVGSETPWRGRMVVDGG